MLLTAMISTLSGLWGVLVTDLFQFVLKMGMMIVLACFAVHAVGGMGALKDKLLQLDAARRPPSGGHGSILSFTPDIGSAWMPMLTFVVYLAVTGGRHGIRARSRAAAAISPRGSCARKMKRTRCWRRFGSISPIMPCAPGRGS